MSTSRRELLVELARMMRRPEGGSTNLGSFVALHAATLAPALGLGKDVLAGWSELDDETVVERLRAPLTKAREGAVLERLHAGCARSVAAAEAIAASARWIDEMLVLDSDRVLGGLLTHQGTEYIGFAVPTAEPMLFARSLLVRARILPRLFLDVACFVDRHGLHFRWRGGRGALDLRPERHRPYPLRNALVVTLPPRPSSEAVGTTAAE